jgi:nitrogen fixation NifU-like protein
MSDELYQQAIKHLARAAHGAGRLPAASASVRLDNPLCGDRITLDLEVEAGKIIAIGHETRGCLLCRAAAAWLGQEAPGATREQMTAAHAELLALLTQTPAASAIRTSLLPFSPVRGHTSRHGCVLLPFRALEQALTRSQVE